MAKKRKRLDEKKEEREYKPPEFDRLDYIRTESDVSKATLFACLFAIPMALAAIFVMPVGGVGGGLIAGLAGLSFLWFLIPYVKVDVKKFKPMNWAGIMGTYFLLFLAVWVVLCNPPFADMATPEVVEVQVHWADGYTTVNESAMGSLEAKVPANTTTILIWAHVTDNTQIADGSVMIQIGGAAPVQMAQTSNSYIFQYEIRDLPSISNYVITAADTHGNVQEGYSFTVIKG